MFCAISTIFLFDTTGIVLRLLCVGVDRGRSSFMVNRELANPSALVHLVKIIQMIISNGPKKLEK